MEGEVELQRETRSSIEIDQNARGEYSLKAKVYYDEDGLDGPVRATSRLEFIDEWFQRRFRVPVRQVE